MNRTTVSVVLVMVLAMALVLPAPSAAAEPGQPWKTAADYMDAGKCQEALDSINAVIASEPGRAPPWNIKGSALKCLGRYEEAIAAFNRAITINASWEKPWHNKGYALLQLDRCREAAEAFDNALAINPGYATARLGKTQAENCIRSQATQPVQASPAQATEFSGSGAVPGSAAANTGVSGGGMSPLQYPLAGILLVIITGCTVYGIRTFRQLPKIPMAREYASLGILCFATGIILWLITITRVTAEDPNALFILVPAILCLLAGAAYLNGAPVPAFWLNAFSAILGWFMFFSTPFFTEPPGNVIMKFALIVFPQTLILVLGIRMHGILLHPPRGQAFRAQGPVSRDAMAPGADSAGHHDVFISYAQVDKPIADALCARLESAGIRCWIAPRDVPPGKDFPEAIIDGIEASRVMVLIFSSHSNSSKHVIRELTSAVSKGLTIVPFRIEDVVPSKSMEYLIGLPHWLDALTPPLEQHLERLVTRIGHMLSDTADVRR